MMLKERLNPFAIHQKVPTPGIPAQVTVGDRLSTSEGENTIQGYSPFDGINPLADVASQHRVYRREPRALMLDLDVLL